MAKQDMTLYSTKLRTLIDTPLDLHGGNVMNIETLIKYNNLLVFITDFHDVDKVVGYMFAKVVESTVTIYEFEIFREFRHQGYARDVLTNCFSNKKLTIKNSTKEHKAFWKKFTFV